MTVGHADSIFVGGDEGGFLRIARAWYDASYTETLSESVRSDNA